MADKSSYGGTDKNPQTMKKRGEKGAHIQKSMKNMDNEEHKDEA